MTPEEREAWLQDRAGFVTASEIATIFAKGKGGGESVTRTKYITKLIAERLSGKVISGYQSQSMMDGIEKEEQAIAFYQFGTNLECVSAKDYLSGTGFVKSKEIKWLGCSPDLIVGKDGLAQFKCPEIHTHVEFLLTGKISRDYILQMQCEMFVMEKNWNEYVSYCPDMPPHLQEKKIIVERDDSLIAEIKDEVIKFLGELDEKLIKLEGLTNDN
jgi:hypothetical protein